MHHLVASKYLILITFLCVVTMLIPVNYRESLYFNIDLAYQGELWRYITGHFTHYSWLHCLTNLAGLYLLCVVFTQNSFKLNFALPTLFIICIISFGLAMVSQEMKWYVGFSGVLIGLLSYASVRTFGQNALLSFAFLLILTTHITSQIIYGGELVKPILISDIYASSYAHLFGFISGFIYGGLENLKDYTFKKT